jgi:hypothetical protein
MVLEQQVLTVMFQGGVMVGMFICLFIFVAVFGLSYLIKIKRTEDAIRKLGLSQKFADLESKRKETSRLRLTWGK